MDVGLVFPVLPPVLDGIGDYTARLAEEIGRLGTGVQIFTAQKDYQPIQGASVTRAFPLSHRSGILELTRSLQQTQTPDWLILQFNQFSYGRWGLNPYVPIALRSIRSNLPQVKVAVMFHEDFVPPTTWRNMIMSSWQRAQFWSIGRLADVVAFSIEPWVKRYESWFPNSQVVHWPVSSNIPDLAVSLSKARTSLDIDTETFVAGIFGTVNASRLTDWIHDAAQEMLERSPNFTVLYVGPDGDALRSALPGIPILDAGALSPEEVSVHLSAMDVHLTPFIDGASTRRGSFLAGLQHGLPTVSTLGPLTDSLLVDLSGKAFALAPVDKTGAFVEKALDLFQNSADRQAMADEAKSFFNRHFSWSTIARQVLTTLRSHTRP